LGAQLLSGAVPPGAATTAALVERVRATRLAALKWTEGATALRARVAFLRRELGPDEWPDWSDKALLATLDEWLAPYLVGATGAADLGRLDTELLLSSQLGWDRSVQLAELEPARLETPAGRSAASTTGEIGSPGEGARPVPLRDHPSVAEAGADRGTFRRPPDPSPATRLLLGGTWADVRGRWPAAILAPVADRPRHATPKRLVVAAVT
jgi:ATP-dependent helicase HrpB